MKIAVIDEDRIWHYILEHLLKHVPGGNEHYQLVNFYSTSNFSEFIDAKLNSTSEPLFDVIITEDCFRYTNPFRPEYEHLKLYIKRSEEFAKPICPIVILSNFVFDFSKDLLLRRYILKAVNKPLSIEDLNKILNLKSSDYFLESHSNS